MANARLRIAGRGIDGETAAVACRRVVVDRRTGYRFIRTRSVEGECWSGRWRGVGREVGVDESQVGNDVVEENVVGAAGGELAEPEIPDRRRAERQTGQGQRRTERIVVV